MKITVTMTHSHKNILRRVSDNVSELYNMEDITSIDLEALARALPSKSAVVYFCPVAHDEYRPIAKFLRKSGWKAQKLGRNPRSGNIVTMFSWAKEGYKEAGKRCFYDNWRLWEAPTAVSYNCCMIEAGHPTYELTKDKKGLRMTNVKDFL